MLRDFLWIQSTRIAGVYGCSAFVIETQCFVIGVKWPISGARYITTVRMTLMSFCFHVCELLVFWLGRL